MSALAWTRAAALLKLPRADGWPAALEPLQCAALQTGYSGPVERREAHLIAAALTDACRAGEIACEAANRVAQPARRRVGTIGPAQPRQWPQPAPPVRTVEVYRVGPHPFAEWLRAQGVEPAALVAAWLAAIDKPAATLMTSGKLRSKGEPWTPEVIAAARAMKTRLRVEGVADFEARVAAACDCTPGRLRQVLGPDESTPKPKPLVGWPTSTRRVYRAK